MRIELTKIKNIDNTGIRYGGTVTNSKGQEAPFEVTYLVPDNSAHITAEGDVNIEAIGLDPVEVAEAIEARRNVYFR